MITVERLVQSYGRTTVLEIEHLEIEPGTTTLVGHNGAGKSTLLLLAAGLLVPTQGTVLVQGARPGSVEARRAVSFVPDQPALFDDLTLGDQMTYLARLSDHATPTAISMHLLEILDAVSLVDRFPTAMSKGQRQKAGLLVAMARPCSVLLTDEPTTGLDAEAADALVEAMTEIVASGVSVVSSTHDTRLIEGSDRSIELAGGRLVVELEAGAAERDRARGGDEEHGTGEARGPMKPGQRPDRWSRGRRSGPASGVDPSDR